MWQVNCSYKRDNTDTKFLLCKKSGNTIEHVLEYGKANRLTLSKENSKGGKQQQGKITTKEGRKETTTLRFVRYICIGEISSTDLSEGSQGSQILVSKMSQNL